MLVPSEPRIGSGMILLVSVHRMPFGSSGAGATVAETGGAEARLLDDSDESGAAVDEDNGAAYTECTATSNEARAARDGRVNGMLYQLVSYSLDVSSESLYMSSTSRDASGSYAACLVY